MSSACLVTLLDSLDQGHHFELQHLDLSENNLDQKVIAQLVHMAPRFPRLSEIELGGGVDSSGLGRVYRKSRIG